MQQILTSASSIKYPIILSDYCAALCTVFYIKQITKNIEIE